MTSSKKQVGCSPLHPFALSTQSDHSDANVLYGQIASAASSSSSSSSFFFTLSLSSFRTLIGLNLFLSYSKHSRGVIMGGLMHGGSLLGQWQDLSFGHQRPPFAVQSAQALNLTHGSEEGCFLQNASFLLWHSGTQNFLK